MINYSDYNDVIIGGKNKESKKDFTWDIIAF